MSLTSALQTATSGLQAAQAGLARGVRQHRQRQHARLRAQDHHPAAAGGRRRGRRRRRHRRPAGHQPVPAVGQPDRGLRLQPLRRSIRSSSTTPSRCSATRRAATTSSTCRTTSPPTSPRAADDPSSSLLRTQAVTTVSNFLSQADRINTQVAALSTTVDSQVADDVTQVNSLLSQIDKLNTDIARAKISGGGFHRLGEHPEPAAQPALQPDERARQRARARAGSTSARPRASLLVGERRLDADLQLQRHDARLHHRHDARRPRPAASPITLASGEIRGPARPAQHQAARHLRPAGRVRLAHGPAVERRHATPRPPRRRPPRSPAATPASTCRPRSAASPARPPWRSPTPPGVVQQTVAIDFTAGTMSVNGGAGAAFTPATFLAQLNAGLGAAGSASFANGALSITRRRRQRRRHRRGHVAEGRPGLLAVLRPERRGHRRPASRPTTPALPPATPTASRPADQITLRVSTPGGNPIRDVTVTVPPAGSPTDGRPGQRARTAPPPASASTAPSPSTPRAA